MKTTFEEIEPVLRIAARKHFWAFCNYMDYDFFQKRRFLKEPALSIDKLIKKEYQRVGISMPPRAGKSYLGTLSGAFGIATNPEGAIMRNCCNYSLYQKFSYATRAIIRSKKFKAIFPEIELSDDRANIKNWSIKQAKGSSFFGNGVEGGIIGDGANILSITDDLYKGHEDAMSEAYIEKLTLWDQSERASRSEGDCPELDIGTRWTKTDFIGKRLEAGDYDAYHIIPALDENDKSFCEEVASTERYLKLRRESDKYVWLSEYMQQPIDAEGLVFPEEQLQFYEGKINDGGVRIAYLDTADAGDDYLSMPIAVYFPEHNTGYVKDVVFYRENLLTNEHVISGKIQEHKIDYLMVETNKEGTFFLNALREASPNCTIDGIFNTSNKMTRIMAQSGWIIQNMRFLKGYEDVEDYNRFMKNLTSLLRSGSRHDDAPDSLAGLASFIRVMFQ